MGKSPRTTEFLRTISPETLFAPETWSKLSSFVRMIPDGDILPTRAKYSSDSNDYQVAVNYLYASSKNPEDGLWYALPDVAASVLLTGRVPKIVDAFSIVPNGQLNSLRAITLRGTVPIDPRTQDFFKTVIEERKRLSSNSELSDEERKRLDKALKVLANAASYGIFAEMRREEKSKATRVTCYGLDPKPFECKVKNPEKPGEYCFPPLASLITAGARLMLALCPSLCKATSIAVFGAKKKPLDTITDGVSAPGTIAFDNAGDLYVANGKAKQGGCTVTVYDGGTNTLLRTIANGINDPSGLAFDSAGNLYVSNVYSTCHGEGGGGKSGVISVYAPGSTSVARTISKGINFPNALMFGP
jgi:hypothetical protein